MQNIIKINSSFVYENLKNFKSLLVDKQLLPITQDLSRLQVLLNYLTKRASVLPHQHLRVPKDEFILIIDGEVTVSIFNDDKELTDQICLCKNDNLFTIVPAGIYHSVDVVSDEAIILQVINGPYVSNTHKEFMN